MTSRVERALRVVTPLGAMATVALGLRIGAGNAVRAAVVYGAPSSGAGTGLAWQVVAFDEDRGFRQPAPGLTLDVTARVETVDQPGDGLRGPDESGEAGKTRRREDGLRGGRQVRWQGVTGADGAAEMLLPFATPADPLPAVDLPALHLPALHLPALALASVRLPSLHLEVRAGPALLAAGDAALPPALVRDPPASSWASFARREGEVRLDVAVLGQRVATGFPAHLWVRATDAATHVALAGVTLEAERDSSFLPSPARVTTDARGWAHLVATPVGHAVGVVLHGTAPGGRAGEWAGGLYVSPGAASLALAERVAPGEALAIDVVVPTLRATAYLEVDDARGRAWAAAVPVKAVAGEMPRASVRVPPLAPGLYWAVEAGDPQGASQLGPGSVARPFFVAASDEAALALGTDPHTCAPPADPRDAGRVMSACLALAGATPVPRWTALEGFTMQHARDAEKRARGMAIALGGLLVAVVLEALLLLRASSSSGAGLRQALEAGGEAGAESERWMGRAWTGRAWTVGIALLVAMMGFALMAAFLTRLG